MYPKLYSLSCPCSFVDFEGNAQTFKDPGNGHKLILDFIKSNLQQHMTYVQMAVAKQACQMGK